MHRTIRLLVLIALAGVLHSKTAVAELEADGVFPSYSVELRAVPYEAPEPALELLDQLRDRGYLAYAYRFDTDGESWLHVAVGAFTDRNAAAGFQRSFTAIESHRASIVEAPVRIIPGSDGRDFVVTPTALWVRDRDGPREVYAFGAELPYWRNLARVILARLSPDRSSLAFVYDRAVHVASLDRRDTLRLTDGQAPAVSPVGDYPWQPDWSPSGRHVVFLDRAVFGQPTGLWTSRSDGPAPRCLACDPSGVQAVRWFIWHPTEDRLLFVRATRPRAVGGELLSAEMDGTVRPVAAAAIGEFEEIVGPLTIEDGRLRFKRLRSIDENYSQHSVTEEQVPIDTL